MSPQETPHIIEQIPALLAGKVSGGEADEMRRHLDGCADCRRELEELEGLRSIFASDKTPELAHSVWPDLERKLEGQTDLPALRQRRIPAAVGSALAAAAGILIAVMVESYQPAAQTAQTESTSTATATSTYTIWSSLGSSLGADRSIDSMLYTQGDTEGEGAR